MAGPTVGEAPARPVHEGLPRRERNRSAYVPEVTVSDLDDLVYVRRPLGDLMAQAVAGHRVPTAEAALTGMAALPAGAPWADSVAEHLASHQALIEALIEAVGSPRLERLYESPAAGTRLGLVRSRPVYGDGEVLVRGHRDLPDALADGPTDAARTATAAHLAHSRRGDPLL